LENIDVTDPNGKLSILHIILAAKETSAPYNEHCLPWANARNITVCAFFKGDVTPPAAIRLFEGDGSMPGFFRVLSAALRDRSYDIIHVHSPHLGVLFLIATFFNRRITPAMVVTVHDSYQNYKFRNKLLFLPVFAGFRRVVCCSRASYDSFPGFFKLLAGDRLCFAQNGPDIERIDRIAARHTPAEPTGAFTSVAIGRMAPVKNPFGLLEAFGRGADGSSRLVWIGDGALRPALMDKARVMGVEKEIDFTGLIPRETVFDHLLDADLYISTSFGEGLPLSVMEAMACGCPVLLSDIPPHREIAETVDFIPLVKPEDAAGFSRELKRFQAMNPEERKAIGRKCRKLVQERFSMTAMHARYREIYSQVSGAPIPMPLETSS
jgi:glycosyltransferase involved in cell wall biosynthesis